MNSAIYNPLEAYEQRLRALHEENANKYFDDLTERSKINIEENRKTVKEYDEQTAKSNDLKGKLSSLKAIRVVLIILAIALPILAIALFSDKIYLCILMILAAVGMVLAIFLLINPKIKKLKEQNRIEEEKAAKLYALALSQMQPLNSLFGSRDAINIIEKTIPKLNFHDCFTAEQAADMMTNYDFGDCDESEESTLDALAGEYNGNHFLFEQKLVHKMGVEVYHGYRTISWTEYYTDSEGRRRSRRRTQTLHATVTKPKPFYHVENILNYCSQGGDKLCFSRDATRLHEKSEKQIDRYVKKGEKKLEELDEQAIKTNDDFVSMSNTEFEVLFDALDRTDEVQYRTLFTPLAQTNMVDLLLSKTGYGDDFNFNKIKRTNKIFSQHSQGRDLVLKKEGYASHSYDICRKNFISQNAEYFRGIYFDFAPLWAIPMYQERPVHSLKPIPPLDQKYSLREYEVLANSMDVKRVSHPSSKTRAILKSSYIKGSGDTDVMNINAFSYDIIGRIEVVYMMGGDGRMHGVTVPWDEYVPLKAQNSFSVSSAEKTGKTKLSSRHGLYAFEL